MKLVITKQPLLAINPGNFAHGRVKFLEKQHDIRFYALAPDKKPEDVIQAATYYGEYYTLLHLALSECGYNDKKAMMERFKVVPAKAATIAVKDMTAEVNPGGWVTIYGDVYVTETECDNVMAIFKLVGNKAFRPRAMVTRSSGLRQEELSTLLAFDITASGDPYTAIQQAAALKSAQGDLV